MSIFERYQFSQRNFLSVQCDNAKIVLCPLVNINYAKKSCRWDVIKNKKPNVSLRNLVSFRSNANLWRFNILCMQKLALFQDSFSRDS